MFGQRFLRRSQQRCPRCEEQLSMIQETRGAEQWGPWSSATRRSNGALPILRSHRPKTLPFLTSQAARYTQAPTTANAKLRLDPLSCAFHPPRRFGVHRNLRSRREWVAERPDGHHSLEILRGRGSPLPGAERRFQCALPARWELLHLRRGDRGHRSLAGPDRRGFWTASGALGRPRAGGVRQALRRLGTVSERLRFQAQASSRFADLVPWVLAHLDRDLSVDALAKRAYLSPRQFSRRFQLEFKCTPGAFVQKLRLDEARERLCTFEGSVETVGRSVGFDDPDSFRRAFERRFGVAPSEYRRRFSPQKLLSRSLD